MNKSKNNPVLIAFAGPAGSGKTSVAKGVIEELGGEDACVRVRFAGPLKAALRTIGLTEAQVDGDEKEVPLDLLCGRTSRYAQKTLGTEWGREMIGDSLWARAAMKQVDDAMANGLSVVIDDLRFDNEALEILARRDGQRTNGHGIYFWIPAFVIEIRRSGRYYSLEHASEFGIRADLIGKTIVNDGHLKDSVAAVLAVTGRPHIGFFDRLRRRTRRLLRKFMEMIFGTL
jgi:hypothetical protein